MNPGEEHPELRATGFACSLCDDGGDLISCEGNCMRAFHFGVEADEQTFTDDACNPTAMPRGLAQRLSGSRDPFICPNCLSSVHQCFSCMKEGKAASSHPINDQNVVRCAVFECGCFYHPHCIGEEVLPDRIFTFVCPRHACHAGDVCKGGDDPLVPCRRCPVAYHERCIRRDIMKTKHRKKGKRVWLAKLDEEGNSIGDPVDKSLVYCMKHSIPKGQENPSHLRPLFDAGLLSAWRHHHAKLYLALPSSVEWLENAAHHAAIRESSPSSQEQGNQTSGERGFEAPEAAHERASQDTDEAPSPPESRGAEPADSAPESADGDGSASEASPAASPVRSAASEDVQPAAAPAMDTDWPELLAQQEQLDAQGSPVGEEDMPDPTEALMPAATPATVGATEQTRQMETDEPPAPAGDPMEKDEEPVHHDEERDAAADELPAANGSSIHDDGYWTEQAMQARREKAWAAAKKSALLELLRQETPPSKPEAYAKPCRKTITEERLQELRRSFRLADLDPHQATILLTRDVMQELAQHEQHLCNSLTPLKHGARHPLNGRSSTRRELLEFVAGKLELFASPGDTIVDFCCGRNDFLPIFKRECLKQGKLMLGRAFDSIPPRRYDDFEQKTWHDVPPGSLGKPESLIIGLNPPCSPNNALAESYINHAVRFKPRAIVLIVPASTKVPAGYQIVHEDQTTMSDSGCYAPGPDEKGRDRWSTTTPSFRILARQEYYPLSHQLHVPAMRPAAAIFEFSPAVVHTQS